VKLSVKRVAATIAATLLLFALICLTAAQAQDADESGTNDAQSAPSITQVAGTWTGTDTEVKGGQVVGSGPMTLDLTQDQSAIGGTFSLTTGSDTPTGTVKGRISGDHLTLTFHTTGGANHKCTANVMAKVTGTTMSGTYLVDRIGKHCKGKGTFDLNM
jgi:hypothetical protein